MINDTMEHFFPHVKKPYYIGIAQGIHNTFPARFELTKAAVDLLPKDDVVWQLIAGGRHWLNLSVYGIMLGADVIRVGMEDTIFLYPDQDKKISSCLEVVNKIVTIARELGREIATPKEARERLGLRQVK